MTKLGHYLDGMIFKLVAKKSFVGLSFKNSKFGECVVVDDSLGSKKLRVRFKDTGYETTATAQQFRKQKVRDRSIPIFLFGFGVNDSVGIIKGSEPKEYRLWRDMVARCYSIKKIFRNKSYENCTISSDFARYSDFASWCQDQVGFGMDNYHLDKDAAGGECPVVLSQEEAPGCGTNSSRFGCWTCTVIEKDKSLQGFVDSGKRQYAPLIKFRDWLKEIRNDYRFRQSKRRTGKLTVGNNGKIIPGPFTIEARKMIFEKLLETQNEFGESLISDSEIEIIQRIWATDLIKM